MSLTAELRRTANLLEEATADARQHVLGLADKAGPHVWDGALPRRVRHQVDEAEALVRRAADELEVLVGELRQQAASLDEAAAGLEPSHGTTGP